MIILNRFLSAYVAPLSFAASAVLLVVLVSGCEGSTSRLPYLAETVFVGEHILTIDESNASATAVAIRGDRIIAVGSEASVRPLIGDKTRVIELGERALIPGFIDSHGHIASSARFIEFLNLSYPPVGNTEDIHDIQAALTLFIDKRAPQEGEWIIGYGYDDSLLDDRRHPNRMELDAVSTRNPILLLHVSGHIVVANTPALESVGIGVDTPDPPGGVIRRIPGTMEPSGILEETATHELVFRNLLSAPGEKLDRLLRSAMKDYAAYGITTAQDGAATPGDIAAIRQIAAKENLLIDVVAYQYEKTIPEDEFDEFVPDSGYVGGYRVAGIKFSLDGSPQGRTAWMTEPYAEGPYGAPDDYTAYATTILGYFEDRLGRLIERGVPVLVHTNGDAAIDALIDGISATIGDATVPDHRTVAIHAQLMREDQLIDAALLGIVPSFFSAHAYFWGDWHRVSFGADRAENISPGRWAIEHNVPFTIHNDAPVVPPDMMRLIDISVNRTTRSNELLGAQQRLTVLEALEAATLTGAHQLFEEDEKGSITVGKRADLVILGANPVLVDPTTIKDIPVLETFARGVSIYKQPDTQSDSE